MNRKSISSTVPRRMTPRQRILYGGLLAAVAFSLLAVTTASQAYVGPGAGISLLGALWALLAVVGSAILYIVLWPLRRMRKRHKQQKETQHSQERRKSSAVSRPHGAGVKEAEERR
ncbi:MAG: hypothetical protein ACRESR_01765 [Gammaproteobacteria bacterium]